MRTLVAATVACSILVGLCQAQSSEASIKKNVNIGAQELSAALQEFARQRELYLIYDDGDVVNHRTAGAMGAMTQDEVFGELLKDTGLTYRYLDEKTVMVVPLATAPRATDVSEMREGAEEIWVAQTDENEAERAAPSKEKVEHNELNEIVVTATKRTESIKDVPLSITAITAEDIERRGFVNSEDYLRGIPAANQTELGWSGQAIVIRGLETTLGAQNEGAGATTATYFGETPTTGSAGQLGSNVDIKLVDIERVEVLRGPQGTAFGSASMGGAVRVIPAAPKLDRFEAKVRAGYSSTSEEGGNNHLVQAVGNAPLIVDKLAIRAVAYRFLDSGFYHNRAGSDPAAVALATSLGAQGFAVDQDEAGQFETTGGRIAALFQPFEELKMTASYLTQKTQIDGWATATAPNYEQTIFQVAPEHVRRGETAGIVDTDIDIGNLLVEYDLGWGSLLGTYSNIKGENVLMHPYTEIGFPWAASDGREMEFEGHIGEIRLATDLEGAWNFLGGLYAEQNEDSYGASIVWYGSPATNICGAGGDRLLGESFEQRDSKQNAAFAEVSWEFMPRMTLTGGWRVYEYDRTNDLDITPFCTGTPEPLRHIESKDSGSNFRANLSYKIDQDALVYASWTQGFRLGKPLPGLPPSCDPDSDGIVDGTGYTIESTRRLDSDAVDSYEIGGKVSLFDRGLSIDAAVFRMDWSDVPLAIVPTCLFSQQVNAGTARSEGIELQTNLRLTDSTQLDIGGSWIKARLTKDVPAAGLFAGDRLAGSPRVNANVGLAHEFNLVGHQSFVRADAVYVGKLFSRVGEALNDQAGDYVKLDVAAGIALKSLDIDLYVRNVTNEDSFTMRSNYGLSTEFQGYRMRPRTIGVQLGYTF